MSPVEAFFLKLNKGPLSSKLVPGAKDILLPLEFPEESRTFPEDISVQVVKTKFVLPVYFVTKVPIRTGPNSSRRNLRLMKVSKTFREIQLFLLTTTRREILVF